MRNRIKHFFLGNIVFMNHNIAQKEVFYPVKGKCLISKGGGFIVTEGIK